MKEKISRLNNVEPMVWLLFIRPTHGYNEKTSGAKIKAKCTNWGKNTTKCSIIIKAYARTDLSIVKEIRPLSRSLLCLDTKYRVP